MLTDRQQRELDYHKVHAIAVAERYQSLNYEVLTSSKRRWWNAYWDIWTYMLGLGIAGKKVLVVGCGAGEDALYFAKLEADVSAFDLSAEMLAHGKRLAEQYNLEVQFLRSPAEELSYLDNT